jgi:hypothetical protein
MGVSDLKSKVLMYNKITASSNNLKWKNSLEKGQTLFGKRKCRNILD